MLAPTTITWPGGSTLELSRSGDRVTGKAHVLEIDYDGQPIPVGFAPFGSVGIQVVDPATGGTFFVSGRNAGMDALAQLYGLGDVVGVWLGEPVDGERSLSDRLAEYVSPEVANSPRLPADFLAECLNEAFQLVERHVGANVVPEDVRSRAILEAASELFHRRQAPNGVSQFAAPDGGAIRIARDPMNAARAILAPFLPLGFA